MNTGQILEFFQKAVSKNRVSHAFIIYGGTEEERKSVAIDIARIIECRTSPKICSNCYSCKTIPSGQFPDVHMVQPEKRNLSIDEVRSIKENMYTKPYYGSRRIFIIETDWMQQPAANSLLKIMEEPPSYGMIIILTRNNKNFLPTIISRAINLKINPDIEMSFDPKTTEEFVQILQSAKKKNWQELFKSAEGISRNSTREEIEHLFDSIISIVRQKVLAAAGFNQSLPEKKHSDIIDVDEYRVLAEILDKRQYLRFNVNTRIFLELLAIKLSTPKWRNWQTR
ncbi:MAG: hypothetical protein N2115_06525 [bacterium]|nr:hypothetical protein [bacterium]